MKYTKMKLKNDTLKIWKYNCTATIFKLLLKKKKNYPNCLSGGKMVALILCFRKLKVLGVISDVLIQKQETST